MCGRSRRTSGSPLTYRPGLAHGSITESGNSCSRVAGERWDRGCSPSCPGRSRIAWCVLPPEGSRISGRLIAGFHVLPSAIRLTGGVVSCRGQRVPALASRSCRPLRPPPRSSRPEPGVGETRSPCDGPARARCYVRLPARGRRLAISAPIAEYLLVPPRVRTRVPPAQNSQFCAACQLDALSS
jgi:hypothetical protein